ncbi:MAG: hypothetical protein SVP52_08700 [Chloroflexota bacterium]|nr:hypothetical protein [Chloroflexota bacterium]
MKRCGLITSLSLVLILFSGCSTPQEGLPTDDVLATQVVIILTETALHSTLPPTETLAPTPTPTEVRVTETPTQVFTQTSAPTETQDLSDPANLLGSPAWTYGFDGSSSPWDFESDQALFRTSDGYLNITARVNPNWHSWWVSTPKLKDAYLEAKIEMGGCAGSDRFGLVTRASSDGEQFYFMGLTCDGRWGFFRMEPDVEIVEIIAFTEADALPEDWTAPHRIGVWMVGSDFRFYFDGEEIGTATDDVLTEEGYTGFLIAYSQSDGFTTRVDQLQYWSLP